METFRVVTVTVIILGLVGYATYQHYQISSLNGRLNEASVSITEANLDAGRAQTEIVSQAEAHKIAMAALEKKFRDQVKQNSALVREYAELEALYKAEKLKGPLWVQEGELFTRVDGEYKLVETLPFAFKDFRIDVDGDAVKKELSYKLHQRFSLKYVETRTKDGKTQNYAVIKELDADGKEVGEATLEKFNVVKVDELPKTLKWWNPKVDLGITAGVTTSLSGSWSFGGGISMGSYGKTEDDVDWRFLRVGVNSTMGDVSVGVAPALWNVGKPLPLISNTYIAPQIVFTPSTGKTSFEFGLFTTL